jgi:hypothetical protein
VFHVRFRGAHSDDKLRPTRSVRRRTTSLQRRRDTADAPGTPSRRGAMVRAMRASPGWVTQKSNLAVDRASLEGDGQPDRARGMAQGVGDQFAHHKLRGVTVGERTSLRRTAALACRTAVGAGSRIRPSPEAPWRWHMG